jgi:hypothetical protein
MYKVCTETTDHAVMEVNSYTLRPPYLLSACGYEAGSAPELVGSVLPVHPAYNLPVNKHKTLRRSKIHFSGKTILHKTTKYSMYASKYTQHNDTGLQPKII